MSLVIGEGWSEIADISGKIVLIRTDNEVRIAMHEIPGDPNDTLRVRDGWQMGFGLFEAPIRLFLRRPETTRSARAFVIDAGPTLKPFVSPLDQPAQTAAAPGVAASSTLITQGGEVLDQIALAHYGTRIGTTEVILDANPGLSALPMILPPGIAIVVPEAADAPAERPVSLYD